MAKRKRGFTREKYDKWMKEGRGQGEGAKYKPWLTTQDVPSLGNNSRFIGIKTQRMHEFFSNNESNFFYITEFSNLVSDIREQYPLLPIEETIDIAQELGIKHPADPYSQEEIVITTDFLITTLQQNNKKFWARTVKECEELCSMRQIEKFEIERRYWEKRGLSWGIVTEKEINKTLAQNIELVYQFYRLDRLKGFENLEHEQILSIINLFKNKITGITCIREESHEFDKRMLLEKGCGISIFKHLIITKQIQLNMLEPIDIDRPMKIEILHKEGI